MNVAQRRLLIATVVAAIFMFLFPPWKGQFDDRRLGYAPITDPPVYLVPWWEVPGHPQTTREDYMNAAPPMGALTGVIWWKRLELQWLCLGVTTVGAVLSLKSTSHNG
jgi:hypothetical protein